MSKISRIYISFSLSFALGFVSNHRTLICVCICRMLFENWCSGVQNVFAIVHLGRKEMCLHSVKCFYFKGANILQRKYQNRLYQASNPLQQKGKNKLITGNMQNSSQTITVEPRSSVMFLQVMLSTLPLPPTRYCQNSWPSKECDALVSKNQHSFWFSIVVICQYQNFINVQNYLM